MKTAITFLLALATFAHAEIATNYLSFNLKVTPQMSLNPGPNSDLPYPPSLTIITYEKDTGWVSLYLSNQLSAVTLNDIANPNFFIMVAVPAWNSLEQGTNAVTFARLDFTGSYAFTNDWVNPPEVIVNNFNVTSVLSQAVNRHWNSWDVNFSRYYLTPYMFLGDTRTGGSSFSEKVEELTFWHNKDIGTPTWELGRYPFIVAPIQNGKFQYFDLTPGNQIYTKGTKWFPTLPGNFAPPQFSQGQQFVSDLEGLIYHEEDVTTNAMALVKVWLQLPLANGDTTGAITNK